MILRLEQYLARVAGGTGAIPESPETNTEAYLAILAGENRQAPEPITRLDMYLYNLVGGNYPIPTPNTRIEQYLAKACGLDIEVPTPITREEQLWYAIAQPSWQLTTLTGTLPLSFKSKGTPLTDYKLYGTADGAGVETENHFPYAEAGEYAFGARARVVSDGKGEFCIIGKITTNLETPVIPLTKPFTFPSVEDDERDTFFLGNPIQATNMNIRFYDENGALITYYTFNSQWRLVYNYPSLSGKTAYGIGFGSNSSASYSLDAYYVYPMFAKDQSITEYIPYGYKLPMTNTSRVTENLFDKDEYLNAYKPNVILNEYGSEISSTVNGYSTYKINVIPEQTYTLKGQTSAAYTYFSRIYWLGSNDEFLGRSDSFENVSSNSILTFTTPQNCYKIEMQFSVGLDFSDVILVKGSTAPDHYIPHRYTATYPLYIGSTKLGAEEYVDYGEQKVYKMSEGALVPTDPPAPLPAINAYKGENTLSSTETLGEVTVKGKIKEVVPNG